MCSSDLAARVAWFQRLGFFRVCDANEESRHAWTEITRLTYQRDGLRYASDIVEAEWAVIDRTCRCQRATGGRARRTWGMSSLPFFTSPYPAAKTSC